MRQCRPRHCRFIVYRLDGEDMLLEIEKKKSRKKRQLLGPSFPRGDWTRIIMIDSNRRNELFREKPPTASEFP